MKGLTEESEPPGGGGGGGAPPTIDPPNVYLTLTSYFLAQHHPMLLMSDISQALDLEITPRLSKILALYDSFGDDSTTVSQVVADLGLSMSDLNQYPEGVRIPVLEFLHQEGSELVITDNSDGTQAKILASQNIREYPKDVRSIAQKADVPESSPDGQMNSDRVAVSRLIFNEDRRFYEVTKILQSSRQQYGTVPIGADWTEHYILHMQQVLYKVCTLRTFALAFGRAALYYSSRTPLLTEKYFIPRINFSVLIKPLNTTMSLQRNMIPEDSMQWAYFHHGVSTGLTASRDADVTGSWIVFNKPPALTAQHGGFLMGLGLNGHLRNLEEWHIYNYLGPKHQHTSIGLLIGMAASALGTMDTKLTKVLSVHVSALLPLGSHNLNVPIEVQTAGLIGIALLYCHSQHRRMSEILLAEIGAAERNEAYRLAAGMALGMINLGKGNDLKGFNDMHIVERLLELAVISRDVQAAHQDETIPGAIVALMFVFLKTNNQAVARKINIPDTEQQLDYIRPDFLLLRVLAKHLIMWDSIGRDRGWIEQHLTVFQQNHRKIEEISEPDSDHMAFFNVIGGLCLAMGLRYSSTGDITVRDTLVYYCDIFDKLLEVPVVSFDQAMVRTSIANVQGVISLALSCVMAGTGDLVAFRRFRRCHGATRADTTFGGFLANEMAMGILFMGSGQWAFKHSNLALAGMVMAFYPVFPSVLRDNIPHLQALRHFWVFAVEPRCLIARESGTDKPCSINVRIQMKSSGEVIHKTSPCIVPQLDEIESISTESEEYYPVTLTNIETTDDLTFVVTERPKPQSFATMLSDNSFDMTTMAANTAAVSGAMTTKMPPVPKISTLGPLKDMEVAERELVFKSITAEPTIVDVKIALATMAKRPKTVDDLWNLRLLFAFAEANGAAGVDDDGSGGEKFRYLSESSIDQYRVDLWRYKSGIV